MSVNVDQIVISDKFKHGDEGFKYFVGYQEGEIFKPLCEKQVFFDERW